ncbi:MAG: molybdenum cofactor guanylyltransferase [Cellvibrionaceae bacterium]
MAVSVSVGILLAGGLSSRMGTDKALLTVPVTPDPAALDPAAPNKEEQISLLSRTHQVMESAGCSDILISRNQETDNFQYIQDIYHDYGPLSGIHACLSHFETQQDQAHNPDLGFLIVPVDMPLLSTENLAALIQYGTESKKACYYQNTVLPCFIPNFSGLLELITRRLSNKQLSITGLLHTIRAEELPSPEKSQLINTNTPEEWKNFQGDLFPAHPNQ